MNDEIIVVEIEWIGPTGSNSFGEVFEGKKIFMTEQEANNLIDQKLARLVTTSNQEGE